jgi:hypothetical protein
MLRRIQQNRNIIYGIINARIKAAYASTTAVDQIMSARLKVRSDDYSMITTPQSTLASAVQS